MSRKFFRWFGMGVLLVCIFGIALWQFAVWSVSGALQSVHFDGLTNILKAAGGRAVVNTTFAPGVITGSGVVAYYQQHPEQMKTDKAFFETWLKAVDIANSSLHNNLPNGWHRSNEIKSADGQVSVDAWGRPFCVKVGEGSSIVISAGPKTLAPLSCSEINLSSQEVDGLIRGRLNIHPSGALILVVNRKTESN